MPCSCTFVAAFTENCDHSTDLDLAETAAEAAWHKTRAEEAISHQPESAQPVNGFRSLSSFSRFKATVFYTRKARFRFDGFSVRIFISRISVVTTEAGVKFAHSSILFACQRSWKYATLVIDLSCQNRDTNTLYGGDATFQSSNIDFVGLETWKSLGIVEKSAVDACVGSLQMRYVAEFQKIRWSMLDRFNYLARRGVNCAVEQLDVENHDFETRMILCLFSYHISQFRFQFPLPYLLAICDFHG
jgi:hypothetical protein